MLPKNLFNEIKKMIFQYTSSIRSTVTAIQNEWTELTVTVTPTTTTYSDGRSPLANGYSTLGSIPIEILPAGGANTYYEFEGIIEYDYGTQVLAFAVPDNLGIVGASSYGGCYFMNSNQNFTVDKVFQIISKSTPYEDVNNVSVLYAGSYNTNEDIVFTTYAGNDTTAGNSVFTVKLKYKLQTLG